MPLGQPSSRLRKEDRRKVFKKEVNARARQALLPVDTTGQHMAATGHRQSLTTGHLPVTELPVVHQVPVTERYLETGHVPVTVTGPLPVDTTGRLPVTMFRVRTVLYHINRVKTVMFHKKTVMLKKVIRRENNNTIRDRGDQPGAAAPNLISLLSVPRVRDLSTHLTQMNFVNRKGLRTAKTVEEGDQPLQSQNINHTAPAVSGGLGLQVVVIMPVQGLVNIQEKTHSIIDSGTLYPVPKVEL